jgi:ribosome-binding protein aMBF1 (putative translation factor)
MTTKICPHCPENGLQPLDDFHNNKNNPDGKATYCKKCTSLLSAIQHAKRRELRNEKRRIVYRNQKPKEFDYTAKFPPQSVIDANIERIVANARKQHTLGWAMLATEA